MSRHRDPAAHPRTVTRPLYAGLCLADAGMLALGCVALLGVGAAPDATARATVPLPTAARSVTVEITPGPWAPIFPTDLLHSVQTEASTPEPGIGQSGKPAPAPRATAPRRTAAPAPTTPSVTSQPPPADEPVEELPAVELPADTDLPADTPAPTQTTAPTPTETDPPPTDVLDRVIDDVTEPEETP